MFQVIAMHEYARCAGGCGQPIRIGETIVRKNQGGAWSHAICWHNNVKNAKGAQVSYGDALYALVTQIRKPGTMSLKAREVRALLEIVQLVIPEIELVSQPDVQKGPPWFGRVSGWAKERVCSGCMSAGEVLGFWKDHVSMGHAVPIRKDHALALLWALETRLKTNLVYAGRRVNNDLAEERKVQDAFEPIAWEPDTLEEFVRQRAGIESELHVKTEQ